MAPFSPGSTHFSLSSSVTLIVWLSSTQFGKIGSVYSGFEIMVAIGLSKPYAKSESGANLLLCAVY
jgi:hypothetical protein